MERFQEIFLADIPCGIFSFDESSLIRSANGYFSRLLGYEEGQLLGKHMTDLFGTAGKIFYGTHLYPMVKLQGRADEIFLKFRSVTGDEVPVLINALVDVSNDRYFVNCACIPVLNRGAYESELLAAKNKAEKALERGTIASGRKEKDKKQNELADKQAVLLRQQHEELVRLSVIISHDLQEPLRKLDLYSNRLLQNKDGNTNSNRALAIIQKSAVQIRHRLLQLEAFLDIKRDVSLDEDVSLTNIVAEQLETIKAMYPDVILDYQAETLPSVKGNRLQLSTMMYELINNSFIHGSVDKMLHLKIRGVMVKENANHSRTGRYEYTDHVQICILDTGKGFEKNYAQHIFEILNKMGNSDTQLGIGLSICKRVVEVHGGEIWAEGRPNEGAAFFFTLPLNISAR